MVQWFSGSVVHILMFNSFITGAPSNIQFDPELAAFLNDSQEESIASVNVDSSRRSPEARDYHFAPYQRPSSVSDRFSPVFLEET